MMLFILSILLLITGVIITCYQFSENGSAEGIVALVITLVISGAMFAISFLGSVPTGYTGILTTFGKVENVTLEAGLNTKAPWQKIVIMDNRVQKKSIDMSCFSSDIQEVTMTYTVNYQISSADAMTIYRTIGTDYYNNVIVPNITEAVKTSVAKYTAENLVNNRSDLSVKIEQDLSERLKSYNIVLVSSSVEDMDFTDAFTSAVEAKQVAQQNKLRAETEAEQRIVEAEAAAEIKKVNAEADSNAKKIAADADAYEIEIKSAAEANANKQIAVSLTEELIKYKYYETWDGSLPQVYGGDAQLINIPIN